MAQVLVIGGGLAGCTSAMELADNGWNVIIVEKSCRIGGKVREYGCKAVDACSNCGVCLAGNLWEQVEGHAAIDLRLQSKVTDIMGTKGDFKVVLDGPKGTDIIEGISSIVIAMGFDEFSLKSKGSFEVELNNGIITGSQLEKAISERTMDKIFPEAPSTAAFLQCFGSRDLQEKAGYCSRVCCAYSTRAARLLKHYYPETKITCFYMDLQQIEEGDYFQQLQDEGMEFIKCRPVKIKNGKSSSILYEEPGRNGLIEREFDLIILTEGIHPAADSDQMAEISRLGQDSNGFLKYVQPGSSTGIFITGCVSGPKRIEEVYNESLKVAREICGGVI